MKSESLTWPQGMAVALLIGAVSWSASTLTDMYRESGANVKAIEDGQRLVIQRNRELDDIKAIDRALLEHALRNCTPRDAVK